MIYQKAAWITIAWFASFVKLCWCMLLTYSYTAVAGCWSGCAGAESVLSSRHGRERNGLSMRTGRLDMTINIRSASFLYGCSNRPQYWSCPSVRPSVCLLVCHVLAFNSKTKKNIENSKLVW